MGKRTSQTRRQLGENRRNNKIDRDIGRERLRSRPKKMCYVQRDSFVIVEITDHFIHDVDIFNVKFIGELACACCFSLYVFFLECVHV